MPRTTSYSFELPFPQYHAECLSARRCCGGLRERSTNLSPGALRTLNFGTHRRKLRGVLRLTRVPSDRGAFASFGIVAVVVAFQPQDAREAGEDDIEAILAEIISKEQKKTAVRRTTTKCIVMCAVLFARRSFLITRTWLFSFLFFFAGLFCFAEQQRVVDRSID